METDEELIDFVERYSGLSIYEIKKKLGWSAGRVDGSVNRLIKAKKIFIKVVERNGRRVKLVYPSDQRPSDLISIPEKKLERGNPLWGREATFYALDLFTIGVAGRNIEEWNQISVFSESVPLTHEGGMVSFKIPEKFYTFYQLHQKHSVLTINSNNLLITVSGDIIDSIEE